LLAFAFACPRAPPKKSPKTDLKKTSPGKKWRRSGLAFARSKAKRKNKNSESAFYKQKASQTQPLTTFCFLQFTTEWLLKQRAHCLRAVSPPYIFLRPLGVYR
jgi:hypothetical protein